MMMIATSESFPNMNTKKRKDVEHFYHDFSSIPIPIPIPPSSKSRRLDPELCAIVEEEYPNHNVTLTTVHQHEDQRALVLYRPENTNNTPFVKSPTSSDFSIIVNSDLIPGLKDYLVSWGILKPDNSMEEEMRREKNSEVSNDCLAVVPWVAFHSPMASEEIVPEAGQPFETKQDEMMELDEPYVNNNNEKAMEIGEMAEPAGASSPWQQQHCMFNHLQNTSTPIHWCYHS